MAQNLIKTNAEAVLPNRPTIVKYVAGLEGGAELIYPAGYPLPEDGVFHAAHPVAMRPDGKWELALLSEDGKYYDFDGANAPRGFGVLAHDVAVNGDGTEDIHVAGAVMLIGVVNTMADDRFDDRLHKDILSGVNQGIAFYGKNLL